MGPRGRLNRVVRLQARIAREFLAWGLGRRSPYRVRGDSMTPTLSGGDLVLTRASENGWQRPNVGAVVVLRDPSRPGAILVKRVSSLGDATFAVGSDNPLDARDSRTFGSLDTNDLLGVVTLVIRRDGRVDLLPGHARS